MTAVSYRQAPLNLRVYALADVVPLLPRLYCAACRGKIAIDPPALTPGVLYCQDCGREYNPVVYERRPPLTPEEIRPKRGRPPKVATR